MGEVGCRRDVKGETGCGRDVKDRIVAHHMTQR